MGVPKFYRWISERYPNISRVINDNQIPDFDNFYLDMNGIIHACSHINEDNCETNVTEEEIFRNIFHYIDFLFRLIKPKKVFFMAVDGVAPRAKMNQQRARRFRAGQDRMRKLKILAEKSNRTLQETTAKHFDTNAITPGTQFMSNLNEQLKYFIHVKLTTDPLWEGVNVHLSGHLTPGEGEHKIMEYIRYTRSQPGYDANTRHCLYGLDADLIMLGLVTHELHFALLREEVKFGSKKISKILTPEEITWHLLHTCLFRDYIDLEFRSMKDKLKFSYKLESIVDDWILMAYLVGNDFIPHLPHVHINEEALSILWDTYKQVLPTLDGYMNESGELNLPRFEIYLTELAKLDHQRYADDNDTFKNLNKLTGRKKNFSENKSPIDNDGFNFAVLDKLTDDTPLPPIIEKPDSTNENLESDDNDLLSDSDTISEKSNDDEDDEKKSSSTITKIINEDDIDKMPLIEAEFRQHKNHYYRDKMKINLVSSTQLQIYVEQYIEALQWILRYYYQGCPSWSWFYPHHYAPYLSDLNNFKDLKISLQKGTPFKPFEQLLSVLPPTSRSLLPTALQSLMVDPASPLLAFYPEDFQLDQNEKKQDWEAIVLLPFIDEQLLLNSITKCYNQLDSTEQLRNQHLPSLCFQTSAQLHPIGNSLGNNPYFPLLKETRASCKQFPIDYYQLDNLQIKHDRFEDKDMIIFPKFPILNVLSYKYGYKSSAVSLFESRSRATTLVINLTHQPDLDCITYNNQWNPKDENYSSPFQITNRKLLIERYLGKRVFVNWPHFQYGIVCAISDFQHLYTWVNIPGGSNFGFEPINNEEQQDFRNYSQPPLYVSDSPFEIPIENNKPALCKFYPFDEIQTQLEYTKAIHINRNYENRQGISIGPIPILLYVSPLIGYRTKSFSTSDKCRTTMCFSNQASAYPLQTTLFILPNYKYEYDQIPQTITDYFQIDDRIFALQPPYYSSLGYIQQINQDNHGKYSISCRMESSGTVNQPDVQQIIPKLGGYHLKYFTAQRIAERLKTAPCVISKITGKINVIGGNKRRGRANPTNIGLAWKVNKPVKQLYGYTKKIDQMWFYSEAAISIISDYMSKFPEIITELELKQKDDNYFESNIWPTNGKHELQQVRLWIKSLPTYSMPLTDGAWQVLDAPVINEIEKYVKSFYAKQAAKNPTKKIKTVSLDPHNIFKASELLGLCDPDINATFYLFDRVVNVRLGTGVPIGTCGTVIGIMLGRTILDTYYEILFDNLPVNSLETILLGKHQQKSRIKVRSYHLLNYSHSLRMRSMNYHQQRSVPSVNVWEQTSSFRQQQQQQPARMMRRNSDDKNKTTTKPKSAPALAAHGKPSFDQVTEQKPIPNNSIQPSVPVENPSLLPTLTENLPTTEISSAPMNATIPPPGASFSSNLATDPFFFRAIQDSEQLQNPLQELSEDMPPAFNPYPDPMLSTEQVWEPMPYQYCENPLMPEAIENMPQSPMYLFDQQSSTYIPFQYQQPLQSHPLFQPGIQQYNTMHPDPNMLGGFTSVSTIIPYDLPPADAYPGYPIRPIGTSIPINHEQQQVPMGAAQFPPPTHHIPHPSPPIQHQQTTSPNQPINKAALQFVPSAVFRNMPKKS